MAPDQTDKKSPPTHQGGSAAAPGDLTTGPVAGHIRRIAWPAATGFFFHTMFNVADTWFAGRLSTQALAALSLSFPVFFLIIAAGSGFSTGATALAANALGRGDRELARTYCIQTLSFGLILSGVMTVLGLAASPSLFRMMGAEGPYLEICLAYTDVIFAGAAFFFTVYFANAALVATGDTRSHRNVLMTGSLINLALDPWFIYGGLGLPAMGVGGIALATVIIQAGGAAYLLLRAGRTGLLDGISVKTLMPRRGIYADILRQGLPAAANMLTVALGIFVITYYASLFGKKAVAAYGAAVRIEQIILLPTIGLNTATLAVASQNNGAGLCARVRQTLNTALFWGLAIMVPGTILLLAGAGPLMGLFTDDPVVAALGADYLRVASLLLYSYVILFLHVAVLQALKRPMFALWIGLYRQLAAPLAAFPLLCFALGMGASGIWWGIFAVNWSAALFALAWARRVLPRADAVDSGPGQGEDSSRECT